MAALDVRAPEGTIALLFTDIVGSTRNATLLGDRWPAVLAEHHAILAEAIAAQDGYVDGTEGDAFFATFNDPAAAARAAVTAQRRLRDHPWPAEIGELKVRMGLHVGHVRRSDTGYVGLEVHRAARVAAAAHGGQVLISAAARGLLGDVVATESVGAHRLKDFPVAEVLYCAAFDGRGATTFPPPRTEEVRPTNLPASTTVLVGRDREIEAIRHAILQEGDRLITLTGRGGAGKTTLATAAAATLLDEHPGGVWLARLGSITEPGAVAEAILTALGADRDTEASSLAVLTARLHGRGPTLLVIDNFEHVMAAATQLEQLLESAPELRLLVTSQAPLRVAAERALPIDALAPEDAVALMERVLSRRRSLSQPAGADREVLRQIAQLLDGLPLALELAAARLTLLTPAQLLERLRSSSDVLRDDRGARPERQRSLRASVQWSLELLDEPERRLFARLGAFAGPVALEELEAVTGQDGLDVLEAASGLLDVALLRRVESGDGRIRFGLPEALRRIAAEMLDESADGPRWRQAHARRRLELVEPGGSLFVPGAVYLAALADEAETDAALRWARAAGDAVAEPLAAAWARLMADLGRLRDAQAVLAPLLASPPRDPGCRVQMLLAVSYIQASLGRHEESLATLQEALDIVPETSMRASILTLIGLNHLFAGRQAEAVRWHADATTLARGLGPATLAAVLAFEAQAHLTAGEIDLARQQLAEARRIGREVDPPLLWRGATIDADLEMMAGRPGDALPHYALSLEAAERIGNEMQVEFDLLGLANALAAVGRDEDALEAVGMAAAQMADLGGSEGLGVAHVQGDQAVRAAQERLGAQGSAGCRARGEAVPAGYRVTRACVLARAATAG